MPTPMPSTKSKLRILIAQGVNLDLLGQREAEVYGDATLANIESLLRKEASYWAPHFGVQNYELVFYQTNHEADYLAKISDSWDGALLNPGAWTHTSLALGDRLAALRLPFIEVHLSKPGSRESFRHTSFCAPHALGVISGLGRLSYLSGLVALFAKLSSPSL